MSRIFQVVLHIQVVHIVYEPEKVKEVSLNCRLPSVFLNYVSGMLYCFLLVLVYVRSSSV